MAHHHTYKVSQYLLLSLPDVDGLSERFTQWACATCPHYVAITGNLRHLEPLRDPPFWDALATQEQRRGGVLAREAYRQQEGWR